MPRNLSKSKLMAGLQCPRRLWLEVNRPELAVVSAATAAAFATGHRVGDVAREIYGGGVGHFVAYEEGLAAALRETRRLLGDPDDDLPVFEATLEHGGVLVRLDVVLREGGAPRVVEVKASASLKEEHLTDCAIQAWVARGAGLHWQRVSLAHVDSTFVYPGGGDYDGLLLEHDITADVERLLPAVPGWIAAARAALGPDEPEIQPGKRCYNPYECPFVPHCWPADAAFPLMGLGGDREFLGRLVAEGYRDIREIPLDRLTSPTHLRIAAVTRAGQAEHHPGAADFLRALGWPRHYLDFETFGPAVPVFPGTRPYETVPFQFSCHRQAADGRLHHAAFLDLTGQDPSRAFAERLIQVVAGEGPILVYTGYEAGVLKKLIARLPDLAPAIEAIVARLVDLHPVTKQNFYHPEMGGSWSLKALLPVIAPDLSYAEAGEVQDGNAASAAYGEAIAPRTTPERREALRQSLERYCALDTLALVRLAEYLASPSLQEPARGRPAPV